MKLKKPRLKKLQNQNSTSSTNRLHEKLQHLQFKEGFGIAVELKEEKAFQRVLNGKYQIKMSFRLGFYRNQTF